MGCVYVFVSKFLWYVAAKNWQNWMTTLSQKVKTVTFGETVYFW